MEVFLLSFVRRMRTFCDLEVNYIIGYLFSWIADFDLFGGFFQGGGREGGVGPRVPPPPDPEGGYMNASTHRLEASTILITLFLLSHPRPKSTKLTN